MNQGKSTTNACRKSVVTEQAYYDEKYRNIVELLGSEIADTREAFKVLEGGFMTCTQEEGQFFLTI